MRSSSRAATVGRVVRHREGESGRRRVTCRHCCDCAGEASAKLTFVVQAVGVVGLRNQFRIGECPGKDRPRPCRDRFSDCDSEVLAAGCGHNHIRPPKERKVVRSRHMPAGDDTVTEFIKERGDLFSLPAGLIADDGQITLDARPQVDERLAPPTQRPCRDASAGSR